MKKLGIVGGLGPMATAVFFKRITAASKAEKDQEHMEILIHSKPSIPKRVEYILGISSENPLPDLVKVAQGLEAQGAEVLALPCVTAHYFYNEIVHSIHVPVLNMIDATALYLQDRGIHRVGILGTEGTLQSGFLQKRLEESGLQTLIPERESQNKINQLIFDYIKADREPKMSLFYEVSEELFGKGAQLNLLACTELSILKEEHVFLEKYLDMMDILVWEAVRICGYLKID